MVKHEFDHEFFNEISKFETGAFLQKFGLLNLEVYKHKNSNDTSPLHIKLKDYGLAPSGYLYLTHWTIRDIMYQKYRRGHISAYGLKMEMTPQEMFRVIGLYNDYENELSKARENKEYIYFTLFGIAEQQFRGQDATYLDDKKRNEIILSLDTEKSIDMDLAIREIMGMSREEFMLIMILLMSVLLNFGQINPYELRVDKDVFDENKIPDFRDKFERVVKYYTATKEFIRDFGLNQTRYRYLFVEHSGTCVLTDGYMLEEKFADAEIWLAREFYRKREEFYGKAHFPNRFGVLFERYVEYVAVQEGISEQLYSANSPDVIKRFFKSAIGKRVDFVVETDRYRLIMECKSGIKPAAVKDSYTNTEALVRFLDKIFDEGATQISTAILNSVDTDKKILGVIVHAEKMFIKKRAIETYLKKTGKTEFQNIILIDIFDLENLFALIKENPASADEILDDYTANEEHEKLDFIQVLNRKYHPVPFLDKVEAFDLYEVEKFLTGEALKHKVKEFN